MKTKSRLLFFLLMATVLFSFTGEKSKKYKCLIQMTNYEGEGAYVIVSLLNAQGKYVKTLHVLGDDDEWYYEISDWWKFYGRKRTSLDGITGATVAGGERQMIVIGIDPSKLDQGYKIRFETAVEDKNYFSDDIQFELTQANLKQKYSGKGFIRYVRFLPQ